MIVVGMEWSEAEFQARVKARLEQLGKPESTALIEAGGTGDEIRKLPKRGRRIDTVFLIARACRWTIGQALGIQDPARFFDREREIDPRKLSRAFVIAEQAIGDNPEGQRPDKLAEAASLVYSVLSEREAGGKSLDDGEARLVIESLLRRFFPK
jgi:hypothetical protein